MKRMIKRMPVVGRVAQRIYEILTNTPPPFSDSNSYWINRYRYGGNSGAGSYNELAEFKAEILNDFVKRKKIHTVIEYGCGDGNQLKFAEYPSYLGFDISPVALSLCKKTFENDGDKDFKIMSDYNNESAELTISLDVVYHLIEDEVFEDYMNRLFDSSENYVVIYSSNYTGDRTEFTEHEYPRKFTEWVSVNKNEWALLDCIPNKFPFDVDSKTGSLADFFIYSKNKQIEGLSPRRLSDSKGQQPTY